MKTNLFNYNSILFTLIIILISTITIWKLPQPQNEYTHIGIAVYDMDDTFMSDYIDKLQNELETCTFNGKKILYEMPIARNISFNTCMSRTLMPY